MSEYIDQTADGLKIYRCNAGECAGQFVVADGAGWIPGVWPTRAEALAGARAYLSKLSNKGSKS